MKIKSILLATCLMMAPVSSVFALQGGGEGDCCGVTADCNYPWICSSSTCVNAQGLAVKGGIANTTAATCKQRVKVPGTGTQVLVPSK